MQQWFRKNWQMIVVVGVLTAGAGLAYRRPPGACLLPGGSDKARPTGPAEYPAYFAPSDETKHPAPTGEQKRSPTGAPTFGGVERATDADFNALVLESNGPVLVDFYADWCPPCRELAPIVEELARENPHVRVVKVNVDHSPEVAAGYRIDSIPTVLVFKGGRVTARHVGLADRGRLEAMLGR